MKLMTTHGSATACRETPHVNQTTRTTPTLHALKRRAQTVLNDTSIDPESRAIIRYALETNDPWLADLVRRVDAGDTISDAFDFSQSPASGTDDSIDELDSIDEKLEAL